MKITINKKIIGMVTVIVLLISIVVGISSASIMRANLTDKIETQLKTGAFAVGQTIELCTLEDLETINKDIISLHDYTDIDVTVFDVVDNKVIRVASTVDNAVGTEIDPHILEDIMTGEDYFATDANVNGQPYFGYYIPFFTDGEFNGATFTGIPQSEANHAIIEGIMKIVGCIIGCGIIAIILAIFLVRGIVKGINKLREIIKALSHNDLSVEFDKYLIEHDEVESACNDLLDVVAHIRKMMKNNTNLATELKNISGDLSDNVENTNNTCNQISQAADNVAGGALSQAEEIENTAQNISEMSNELEKIKNNTNELHSISESMNEAKNNAINTLVELQQVNKIMSEDIDATNNQVVATTDSVEQIKKAVNMIIDIADQTQLLSLNASIEAAHAGDHGKGFAVVAEEIGKLASQSAQSSGEIEEILKQLIKNYDVIIEYVKRTSNNMFNQNEKLINTENVFSVLEKDINKTVEKIEDINKMVINLDEEITKLVDMIASLSAISEENGASAEEMSAAIEELANIIRSVYEKAQNVDKGANDLMQEVSLFKTV